MNAFFDPKSTEPSEISSLCYLGFPLCDQFNREIVIVHSVSEMMTTDRTGQIDDKFSEKDKICFEVEVNCDGDESENLNPIWLVDGELVLSQKSYFSQVSQNW